MLTFFFCLLRLSPSLARDVFRLIATHTCPSTIKAAKALDGGCWFYEWNIVWHTHPLCACQTRVKQWRTIVDDFYELTVKFPGLSLAIFVFSHLSAIKKNSGVKSPMNPHLHYRVCVGIWPRNSSPGVGHLIFQKVKSPPIPTPSRPGGGGD